jgi:hypothetical protein
MRKIVRYLLAVALFLSVSAGTWATAAEPETREPSERQVELNASAVEAIEKKQYSLAINRLEESLEAGPLNITYLNMGRAYQLMGRCQQALDAYDRVDTAPRVPEPRHDFIMEKVASYRDETRDTCEQGAAQAGTGASGGVKIIVREQPANLKPWAWTATSSGVALGLTAVGVHLWARSIRSDLESADRNGDGQVTGVTQQEAFSQTDKANTLDTVALSTGIVGGVFAAVGVYLFVADASQERDATVGVGPVGSGFGLTFSGSF